MYIKTVTIQNVRSLANLTWQIEEGQAAGWHVILGDNGAGKTAFVRSIALALVGSERAWALRLDWSHWLRSGEKEGQVTLNLVRDKDLDEIPRRSKGQKPRSSDNSATSPETERLESTMEEKFYEFPSVNFILHLLGSKVVPIWFQPGDKPASDKSTWEESDGWFSASYGPFRRFSGGDDDYTEILRADPKLARHVTIFGENVALTETLKWLKDLRFKQLEQKPEGQLLDLIKAFVNQDDFLPNGVCLNNVSSDEVEFVDGNGYRVAVEGLSDGYRSVLSLTFELIRQLAICYGPENIFAPGDPTKIIVPGVVLIDEVDAHLHPTWQRRIGLWFRKHFPNIQFIVTTHSPFVCQAATHGTVFKLPTPGTSEEGHMIIGAELNRLLYGNILEAYSTEAFGSGITRSEASRDRTRRLAELNRKELHGDLTAKEEKEQTELRAMLPTTAHILNEEAAV